MRKEQAELWQALPGLGMHYSDGASSLELGGDDGKTEKRKERQRRRPSLYRVAKKQGNDMQPPAHASVKPEKATGVPRSQRKLAGGDSCPMALFPLIIELPLILNS